VTASETLGTKWTAWWRTQSLSNPSPRPYSVLTGKLTGNFEKIATPEAAETVNLAVVTEVMAQIPYSEEQGIILAEQGILEGEQGILLFEIQFVAR
jgi:hypothetical protein